MVSVRRTGSAVVLPYAGPSAPGAVQAAAGVLSSARRGRPADASPTVLELEVPSTVPEPGEHRPAWRSPRRRLVALGLVAVLVHVALAGTALLGLAEVARANADVAGIVTAQRAFQDADMAHDAIIASATGALAEQAGLLPPAPGTSSHARTLRNDVQEFRDDLDEADRAQLPGRLEALLTDVRVAQDRYALEALRIADALEDDPAGVRPLVPGLWRDFHVLVEEQQRITDAMSGEADRRRLNAQDDRQAVRARLIASAAVALLGLLGITALLHRMGGDLATLIARERGVAETLQLSLLPDRLPDLPGLRLAARYRAGAVGTQVGGDWYDVVLLPGGRVGLVMGDVVGHDLGAASSMGQLRNALRACAAEGAPPAEVLQRLNRLCLTQDMGDMATVLYAVLDPVSGEVEIANAGHCPPLLVTSSGRRFLEAAPCPPVGAVREAQYTSSTHTLPPGSLLVLYTDGLVERRGAPVDEGMDRLSRLVVEPPDGDLDAVCDDLLTGMVGDHPTGDDVALLLVAPQALLGPHVDVVWPAQAERLSLLRSMLERWLAEAGADEGEVYDVLVACSEAATNAIEHAYGPARADFRVVCDLVGDTVTIVVRDWGQWREARGQDRGRGRGLMEELMDEVQVAHGESGTEVRMVRRLQRSSAVAGVAAQPA